MADSEAEPMSSPSSADDVFVAGVDGKAGGLGKVDLEEGLPAQKTDGLKHAKSTFYEGQSMAQEVELLEPIPTEKEVTLTFTNINSWVPNLTFGSAAKPPPGAPEPPAKRQVGGSSFVSCLRRCMFA